MLAILLISATDRDQAGLGRATIRRHTGPAVCLLVLRARVFFGISPRFQAIYASRICRPGFA